MTRGEVIAQILSEIARNDTSITSFVTQEVLNAVNYYETQRFWFNELRSSFTASSTIYYPLATVAPLLIEPDVLTVTISGSRYDLERESFETLEHIDTTGETGYPSRYAIFNQQIRLYPKPNAVYQIDIAGQFKLATLSADADTNAWTTDAADLIIARAEKQLYARRFQDFDAALALDRVEMQALERLNERTNKTLGSGKITPGW